MKAIVYHRHGPPDVLRCEETERPTAGDAEVLIRVRAASVKPSMLLHGLMRSGKVTPVIDRRYALSEVPEAIRYLEAGARGRVVIVPSISG